MEKNVRCSTTAPAASKAVRRRPFGCWVCAPGGNIMSRWNRKSLASSNSMERAPARSMRRAARIPLTVTQSPRDRSLQVHCPPGPIAPPGRLRGPGRSAPASHRGPLALAQRDRAGRRLASSRANRHAARIGPMVCELEGPTPILYRSNRLVVTNPILPLENYLHGFSGHSASGLTGIGWSGPSSLARLAA